MVFPVIVALGLLFLVAVYFAVMYWYITLPIIVLAAILVRHYRIKNKKREEERAAAERRRQKFQEERRQREAEQETEQERRQREKCYENVRDAFENLFNAFFAYHMRIAKYYQVLGLESDATYDQLKKRFRELSLKYHPDRNKSPDAEKKFKQIYKAFTVIKNRMEKNRRYEKSQTH